MTSWRFTRITKPAYQRQIYSKAGGGLNYITEINAFEQWLETNYLPQASQLLWYKLIALCNRCGWAEWITVDNRRLMAAMQMNREATFIECRNNLIKAGLIKHQKGKKGSPNRYKLISFTTICTFKSEVQTEVQSVVETVDINKQNKTINYQLIADMYNDSCKSLPKCTKLSDRRKEAIRARLNTYTIDDFKDLFETANQSDFLNGKNKNNWMANFDWLTADANMAKVLDGNYANKGVERDIGEKYRSNIRAIENKPLTPEEQRIADAFTGF